MNKYLYGNPLYSNFVSSSLQSFTNMQAQRTPVSMLELIRHNEVILHILLSVLSITLFWLARFLILRFVWRYSDDVNVRYRWRKNSSYVTLGLNIIIISQIWISEFNNLLTYLGLVSAGIAIALKDFVVNFLGWLFILSSKPFAVQDRIQIDNQAGDVIDIKAFYFTLMEIGNWVHADQSTGRILHIPNGQIFTRTVANYSKAFQYIWNELPVTVTFDSDWQKAKKILLEIVNELFGHLGKRAEKYVKDASKQFMIYFSTLSPAVYVSIREDGIMLTLRYICDPKLRRNSVNMLTEKILERFNDEKTIKFAYRTLTLHSPQKSKN